MERICYCISDIYSDFESCSEKIIGATFNIHTAKYLQKVSREEHKKLKEKKLSLTTEQVNDIFDAIEEKIENNDNKENLWLRVLYDDLSSNRTPNIDDEIRNEFLKMFHYHIDDVIDRILYDSIMFMEEEYQDTIIKEIEFFE